jgi:hypothetical protein
MLHNCTTVSRPLDHRPSLMGSSVVTPIIWVPPVDPQPGLPGGLSAFEQDVTVKEGQAVNRASGASHG